MKPTCMECRFLNEMNTEAHNSGFECRRYPKREPVSASYGCGEFQPEDTPTPILDGIVLHGIPRLDTVAGPAIARQPDGTWVTFEQAEPAA